MDNDPENISELAGVKLPLAMTRQQVEVFELLQSLSTKKKCFHKWYQGAIESINSQNPDKIAQAAHSLRELCDELPNAAGIPRFINPISTAKPLGPHFLELRKQFYSKGWEGNPINPALDDVLSKFEVIFKEPARSKRFGRALIAADPQSQNLSGDWQKQRDEAFEELYIFFQDVAHHNRIATQEELNEKLKFFETLLLNYLTPSTATQQKDLLRLMTGPANSETFKKVKELISHKAANLAFFCDKLENPDWLPILDQQAFFSNLPGPEFMEDGRMLYRHYLPLIVLTRLAEKAQDVVTGILIKMRLPENPYVGDQILQCMAKIGDPACIRQLSPLIAQFAEHPRRTTWLSIQELLKSWMELKAYAEIFAILEAYLISVVDKSFEEFNPSHGTWLAQQVEEQCLNKLTFENPFEIAKIVFHALCKWADQEREKYSKSEISDDAPFSYFVEDFKAAPPEHRGIEATLARRLFLAAEQVYTRGDIIAIGQLDALLSSHHWQLFRRLRWQLYANFPKATLKNARAEVLRRIPFLNEIDYDRGAHDYEFAQLLVAHVKNHGSNFLSPEEVALFTDVVWKGPLDKDGKLLEGDNAFFYRKQLWPISPLLGKEQLAAYRVLVPDDDQIKIDDFKPYSFGGISGGSVVSVAPKQVELFGSMTDREIWDFLNNWQPEGGYRRDDSGNLNEESIFAVAQKFADFVKQFPQRFSPEAKWWNNITREEILSKFLDGAADKLSKKEDQEKISSLSPSQSEWSNWFGISQTIMSHSWSRYSVSRFLRNALISNYPIPNAHDLEVANLLKQLISEPDKTLLGRNGFGDWLTTAINSVRGQAVEALLNLAAGQKNTGKKIEPWIFELIRSRLELPEESPATFALLGANLRFLIHLFDSEIRDAASLLLPQDRPEHLQAFLTAHFKFDRPWKAIIDAFPKLINNALDNLEAFRTVQEGDAAKQSYRDFGSRLGIHIACYYWSSSFANDSEGESALDRFFYIANQETRAGLVNQIASIWEKHSNEPSEGKVISRVLRIWERRSDQIEKKLKASGESTEYDGELAESIDWLNCECFPFEWRSKNAKLALERLKKAPRAYQILKAITEFGTMPNRLKSMMELLRLLLKKPSDELRWSIQFKDLAPIVSLGFTSNEPSTRKLAEECKDLLLRMGFSDFLNVGN